MIGLKLAKLLTVLLLGGVLSSCAVYGTKFECPAGKGMRCTSVSKINKMIDKGMILDDEEEKVEKLETQKPVKRKHKQQKFDVWLKQEDNKEKYI